jgi:hypothetical protein
MLCASLPAIRAGLVHFFPKVWGTTFTRTKDTHSASRKSAFKDTLNSSVSAPHSGKWPALELASLSSVNIIEDEEARRQPPLSKFTTYNASNNAIMARSDTRASSRQEKPAVPPKDYE